MDPLRPVCLPVWHPDRRPWQKTPTGNPDKNPRQETPTEAPYRAPKEAPDRNPRQETPTGTPDSNPRQEPPTGDPDRSPIQEPPTGTPDRRARQRLREETLHPVTTSSPSSFGPRVMLAQPVISGAGESLRYKCGERRSSNLLKDSKATRASSAIEHVKLIPEVSSSNSKPRIFLRITKLYTYNIVDTTNCTKTKSRTSMRHCHVSEGHIYCPFVFTLTGLHNSMMLMFYMVPLS
nr:uncharacterized protein DKFZp434B061-like [Penaeus vannamei]